MRRRHSEFQNILSGQDGVAELCPESLGNALGVVGMHFVGVAEMALDDPF